MTRVVVQNLRALPKMRQAHVLADVAASIKAAGHGGVVLWSEAWPARYRRALRNLPDHWHTFLPETPKGQRIGACISWDGRVWELVEADNIPLHGAVPFVCEQRRITYALLRNRGTGRLVAFSNRHYVPGAYAPGYRPFRARRVEAWKQGHRRDLSFHSDLARAGYMHVGGGDLNRRLLARPYGNTVEASPRQRVDVTYPEGQTGVDRLWFTDAPHDQWTVAARAEYLTPRYSDHPGLRARYTVPGPYLPGMP